MLSLCWCFAPVFNKFLILFFHFRISGARLFQLQLHFFDLIMQSFDLFSLISSTCLTVFWFSHVRINIMSAQHHQSRRTLRHHLVLWMCLSSVSSLCGYFCFVNCILFKWSSVRSPPLIYLILRSIITACIRHISGRRFRFDWYMSISYRVTLRLDMIFSNNHISCCTFWIRYF